MVGVFLSAMDNTIVVSCAFPSFFSRVMPSDKPLLVAFGAIGTHFNELKKTSWIATAYLLTVASFQSVLLAQVVHQITQQILKAIVRKAQRYLRQEKLYSLCVLHILDRVYVVWGRAKYEHVDCVSCFGWYWGRRNGYVSFITVTT